MAKKDFSNLNTGRVYDAIAEATAEPEEQQRSKDRSNLYTEEQRAEYARQGRTQGRPGCKMARINLAFYGEQYEYVKIMSKVRGETMTQFINHIIETSMKDNAETYEKAKAFRDAL